jgi:PPOX class probable F420-dependent enzyme
MIENKTLVKQKYLNVETFRRCGLGVKTPVWFVQDGDILYVRTGADSGKVKRIRLNPVVNIAPCKMDGALVGEWMPAIAREVNDEMIDQKVDQLLDQKYGIMKKLFMSNSKRNKFTYTIIELKVRK